LARKLAAFYADSFYAPVFLCPFYFMLLLCNWCLPCIHLQTQALPSRKEFCAAAANRKSRLSAMGRALQNPREGFNWSNLILRCSRRSGSPEKNAVLSVNGIRLIQVASVYSFIYINIISACGAKK
jgi:hypothetical protein